MPGKCKSTRATFAALSILSLALVAVRARADEEWTALCKYDNYCGRAVDRNGNVLKPKPEVTKLCEEFSDDIVKAGEDFGVDPRTIAGSVMAENTMNVQVTDDVKRFLASAGTTHIGTKYFSIGPGQIHTDTAMTVEPMMAKLEHRPERSEAEVAKALLNPKLAFRYAGAILRQAQDEYKKNGIDVSKRPDLLTTLYNLGKVEEKASNAHDSGVAPRPNYFGYFVKSNIDKIGETIGWDPIKGRTRKARVVSDVPMTTTLNSGVSLATSPPSCDSAGSGQIGDYNSKATLQNFPQLTGLRSRSNLYRVIGKSVDCGMRDWQMVETGSGQVGWAPKDQLEGGTEFHRGPTTFTCKDSPAVRDCKKQVLGVSHDADYLGHDAEGDLNYLPLSAAANTPRSDTKPLDFKNFNVYCIGNDIHGYNQTTTKMKAPEARAYAAKLEATKARILSALDISQWYDSKNPLRYNGNIESVIESLKACSSSCNANSSTLEALAKFDPASLKSLNGVFHFAQLTQSASVYNFDPARNKLMSRAKGDATMNYMPSGPKFTELMDLLRKKCAKPLKQDPEYKQLADQVDAMYMKKITMLRYNMSSFSTYLTNAGDACENLDKIDAYKAGDKSIGSQTCALQMNGGNLQSTVEALSTYEMDEDNRKKILQDPLKAILQQMGQYSSGYGGDFSGMDCRYDPLASAERVNKIASLSCVEAVLSPDPYLVKAANSNTQTKIMLYPMDAGDRFAVKFKDSCTGQLNPLRDGLKK